LGSVRGVLTTRRKATDYLHELYGRYPRIHFAAKPSPDGSIGAYMPPTGRYPWHCIVIFPGRYWKDLLRSRTGERLLPAMFMAVLNHEYLHWVLEVLGEDRERELDNLPARFASLLR
jgi:hypothetical protein